MIQSCRRICRNSADQKQQKQLSALSRQLESRTHSVDVSAVKRRDQNGRNEGKMPNAARRDEPACLCGRPARRQTDEWGHISGTGHQEPGRNDQGSGGSRITQDVEVGPTPRSKGYKCELSTMRRSDFLRDKRRLCSRRRALDAREGLVGMRGLAVWFNPMSFRRRRWRARFLLRPWRRCSDATTVIPVGMCTSLTALSTLFLCWPPGPPPRKGWNCTSLRRISGSVL